MAAGSAVAVTWRMRGVGGASLSISIKLFSRLNILFLKATHGRRAHREIAGGDKRRAVRCSAEHGEQVANESRALSVREGQRTPWAWGGEQFIAGVGTFFHGDRLPVPFWWRYKC